MTLDTIELICGTVQLLLLFNVRQVFLARKPKPTYQVYFYYKVFIIENNQ